MIEKMLEPVCVGDLIFVLIAFIFGFIADFYAYNVLFKRIKDLDDMNTLNNYLLNVHVSNYHDGVRLCDFLEYASQFQYFLIYEPVPGDVLNFRDLYEGYASNVPDELMERKIKNFHSSGNPGHLSIGLEEVMNYEINK